MQVLKSLCNSLDNLYANLLNFLRNSLESRSVLILLGNSFDIFTTLWIYINETHLIAYQCHPSIVGPREWSHLEKIFFESFEFNEKLSKTLKTLLSMAMAIGTCDIWSIPYLMFNDCDQWNFMIRYYRGVSVIDKLNTPATLVPVVMIF